MKTTLARSGLAAALVFLLAGFLAITSAQAAGEVLVLFYDRDGGVLTPTEMRATSNNGEAGYDNDYLVDPTTLQAVQSGPLVEDPGQGFTFSVQDSPVALALNWHTLPLGYGLVIVDNNGVGYSGGETINFSYQAAYDIRRRLASALAAVSGHFKMHHLWSLQSAPPLTGVFLGFLGSFWQGVFLFP
jgi:hypothetical protein